MRPWLFIHSLLSSAKGHNTCMIRLSEKKITAKLYCHSFLVVIFDVSFVMLPISSILYTAFGLLPAKIRQVTSSLRGHPQ